MARLGRAVLAGRGCTGHGVLVRGRAVEAWRVTDWCGEHGGYGVEIWQSI